MKKVESESKTKNNYKVYLMKIIKRVKKIIRRNERPLYELIRNKKRDNIHSKTISGETAHPNNKILNNNICFNEKIYLIKTLSKHSSTFLILSKQKNSAGYLKNLCNNLKICKNEKKPIKKCETINLKSKGLNLSQDKKTTKKSNKSKKNPKSKKENKITYSLFRKSQKENCLINPKRQMTRKSVNSVRIKFQKE